MRNNVLCIDPDSVYLENQLQILERKNLSNNFFPFDNLIDAVQFVEKQVIRNGGIIHYIVVDDSISDKLLGDLLDKVASLKQYLKQPDIIVCASNNNEKLRNKVMQYSFVSAFLVKPIPENYFEFLITGRSG